MILFSISRGYEYRDGNQYSALPQRNEATNRYRSHPNDVSPYHSEQPGSSVDHYKAEDPYEWVAPRRQQAGNQRPINRNTGEFQNGGRPVNRNSGEYRENAGNNGRSFMNQIYMDTAELMRLRQEKEQQGLYGSPERSR